MTTNMEYRYITFCTQDGVAMLGLNRPDKCNAINGEFSKELGQAIRRANSEAKACIIFGHGKHFCAGLDLAWMRDRLSHGLGAKNVPESELRRGRAMESISNGGIPYIAAIHGACIGLGFELAAAAHIRVIDNSAHFRLPEAQHGIFLGGGGAARISRLIGVARMQDMMLTGRSYDAKDCVSINLAQYLVEDGQAVDTALQLAQSIEKNPELSNFAILNCLPRINEMAIDDGIFWESVITSRTFGKDSISRMTDFLESK